MLPQQTISLAGLSGPATISIDQWGVPHIEAGNESDLFFAQGVNAARDRLWQLDLWRKRGLGLLAADFGLGFLAQDFASRLFLYRGSMDEEWLAYSEDAREIFSAFAAGINPWIALCEQEPERLPPEFAEMGMWACGDYVPMLYSKEAISKVTEVKIMLHPEEKRA